MPTTLPTFDDFLASLRQQARLKVTCIPYTHKQIWLSVCQHAYWDTRRQIYNIKYLKQQSNPSDEMPSDLVAFSNKLKSNIIKTLGDRFAVQCVNEMNQDYAQLPIRKRACLSKEAYLRGKKQEYIDRVKTQYFSDTLKCCTPEQQQQWHDRYDNAYDPAKDTEQYEKKSSFY